MIVDHVVLVRVSPLFHFDSLLGDFYSSQTIFHPIEKCKMVCGAFTQKRLFFFSVGSWELVFFEDLIQVVPIDPFLSALDHCVAFVRNSKNGPNFGVLVGVNAEIEIFVFEDV